MSHYNQGCITIQYLLYIHLHRTVEHLGSGQFGTVEKGVWKCPRGEEEVAIKLLQSGASDEDRVRERERERERDRGGTHWVSQSHHFV